LSTVGVKTTAFATTLDARVLRHDEVHGLSTLYFGDGELRVPLVAAPVNSGMKVTIYARDVSIALSRPMDVSITNRLPGTIVAIEPLALKTVAIGKNAVRPDHLPAPRRWPSGDKRDRAKR
jgi:molybdate transport system ATP-binding protein